MTECLLACMRNLPGVWCQFSVQLYSSMVILKLNPKFLPSSVVCFFFFYYSPKIGVDLWQCRDIVLGNVKASIISEDANIVVN